MSDRLEGHLTCIRSGVTPCTDRAGLSKERAAELRQRLAELANARAR